ncbi:expression library immunization antigen 1 [Cordyceps militaris]|uniref:Expression library immunization antigen 1 n=1 Tax=Cordyceps militaris TaxID=73501 RepID=A0A2H4SPH6_CORMI|nr:expression library immunization antigen 1 [Cordyceps militaris]
MRSSTLPLLAALAGLTTAHFQLKYPPTIGFEDAKEDTAPCGGFTPDLAASSIPDFHIGGDAVAVRLSHPQSKWLFRVTTSDKPSSDGTGWEQIYPIVLQSGLGDFCLPQLTVPAKYEGKKGVLSIVSSAVDGLLYQCSVVNFVSGSQKAPSVCTNATITVNLSSDTALSALVSSSGSGDNATSTTGSGGASSTSASASASASPTKNAAAAAQAGSGLLAALGGLLLL